MTSTSKVATRQSEQSVEAFWCWQGKKTTRGSFTRVNRTSGCGSGHRLAGGRGWRSLRLRVSGLSCGPSGAQRIRSPSMTPTPTARCAISDRCCRNAVIPMRHECAHASGQRPSIRAPCVTTITAAPRGAARAAVLASCRKHERATARLASFRKSVRWCCGAERNLPGTTWDFSPARYVECTHQPGVVFDEQQYQQQQR